MANDTTTTLNTGTGGDLLDSSLIEQTDGTVVTEVKRQRLVLGGDDGRLVDPWRGETSLPVQVDDEARADLASASRSLRKIKRRLSDRKAIAQSKRIEYQQGGGVPFRITPTGSLGVAFVEGPKAEAAKAGRRFMGGYYGGVQACVNTLLYPTTVASYALYNANKTKSIVIDAMNVYEIRALASGGISHMIFMMSMTERPLKTSELIVTSDSTSERWRTVPTTPGPGAGSGAIFWADFTMPLAANGGNPLWVPVAGWRIGEGNTSDGSIGTGTSFDWQGGVILPPGFALGFYSWATVNVTSQRQGVTIFWNEVDIDLE